MENNKMKTSYVAPGMVVAKDIYSSANQLIVPAGTELTDSIISRLKLYSVSEIPVTAVPKRLLHRLPQQSRKRNRPMWNV